MSDNKYIHLIAIMIWSDPVKLTAECKSIRLTAESDCQTLTPGSDSKVYQQNLTTETKSRV